MSHECTIKELIDGVVAVPSVELSLELTDSDTGEVLHKGLASSDDSVERALAAAQRVHESGSWFDLPASEKADMFRALQAKYAERMQEMAAGDTLDSGVPMNSTSMFAMAGVSICMTSAMAIEAGFGHEEVVSPTAGVCDQWELPWGPAAVLVPWNAPTVSAIKKIGEGLVAGCPIIVKPSEWAPHFTGPLAEAIAETMPPGVVQIVHGGAEVGAKIVGDPRVAVVSYTGGVPGGTAVAEACARQMKPADLELSGNNPVVVLPDADVDTVLAGVLMGLTTLNGQICVGPRRLIVHEDQKQIYVDAFSKALGELKIGLATGADTQLGPMSSGVHQRKIESQIAAYADAGCDVTRFGELPEHGHFVQPALIDADAAPQIKDEIFGPVLQVRTYKDVDEAIAIANDHAYGLAGYVYGTDRDAMRKVGRKVRGGLIRLNSHYGALDVPMGVGDAWGISGIGTFGIGETTKMFSGKRWVS